MDATDRVIVRDGLAYVQPVLEREIGLGLEQLGLAKTIQPGMTALVKPNVLAAVGPERRVTTHPIVVAAVIASLRRLGCKVIVADSSGGGMEGHAQTRRALETSGIAEVARANGAIAKPLEEYGVRRLSGSLGSWDIWLSPLLQQVDVVVNVPVFKTHTATVITGAVKNLFGCVPGHLKASYHKQLSHIPTFSRFLVDLALAVKPDVTIVDAIECMHGDGPMGGYPFSAQKILIGRNPFAVDTVLTAMAGVPMMKVPTVAAAVNAGLSKYSAEHLTGMPVSPLQGFVLPQTVRNDWSGRFLFRTGIRWRRLVPAVNIAKCRNCGQCAAACPVDAITLMEDRYVVNRNLCLRCLCCHELCTVAAIELRPSCRLRRMLSWLGF